MDCGWVLVVALVFRKALLAGWLINVGSGTTVGFSHVWGLVRRIGSNKAGEGLTGVVVCIMVVVDCVFEPPAVTLGDNPRGGNSWSFRVYFWFSIMMALVTTGVDIFVCCWLDRGSSGEVVAVEMTTGWIWGLLKVTRVRPEGPIFLMSTALTSAKCRSEEEGVKSGDKVGVASVVVGLLGCWLTVLKVDWGRVEAGCEISKRSFWEVVSFFS